MPLTRKPMRYAHPEGHTDVCYHTNGEGLATCGSDGDVRSWLNLMDDDPAASCIAEQATTIVSKNGKLYVGTDNNTVQILTYPDLEKEGIVTRFSATVSALATATNSKLIVAGACDMRIQVSNIDTLDSIELNGHEAPILGLSLDPREEYVASSSADGSLRVWDIKEKRVAHIWNNVVPKCNSFFTSKIYSTPSFNCKDGSVLAYPHGKEVVVVERSSWRELFKLRCPDLRTELSICKFSECGTRLAASSVHGEVVVWEVETKEQIGYNSHEQNAKITAIAWSLDKPDEISFCDSLGHLGCIDVLSNRNLDDELSPKFETNGYNLNDGLNIVADDDDDTGENVISLNKIKASVKLEDDYDAGSAADMERPNNIIKAVLPEVNVQEPFQPGSSPVHLLSRFMVWNNTGIVKCYNSEDGDESSIDVEFHDTTIHHAIHINNYLGHTLAALSSQALVLACPSNEDGPSKVVVVVLQGWGSGNKEWSMDLPQGENAVCVAVGEAFVAVSTSRRHLRLFTVGGTQREVLALPGPAVAMNACGDHLLVVYHAGLGVSGDQHLDMLWIRIRGVNLFSQKLPVPLSPTSDLMWLGLTDEGSPTIVDADGVIRIYTKKSSLWRVACESDSQCKGKSDHFFVIGVSEAEKIVRCVLCKGSHYPATTPRPAVNEIPLLLPLCEPDSEKSEKEAKLWQLGTDPREEKEVLLSLFALACRSNVEFRAVELCEQIASQKLWELAMKYAGRLGRMALANKLQSSAEAEEQQEQNEDIEENENVFENNEVENIEEPILTPVAPKKPVMEIKPLALSVKRSNPFLKSGNSPMVKGLCGMNNMPDKPQKPKTSVLPSPKLKPKPKSTAIKETFACWFSKNQKDFQDQFPEMNVSDLTKTALKVFKKEGASSQSSGEESPDNKKRKLSDPVTDGETLPKKLAAFAYREAVSGGSDVIIEKCKHNHQAPRNEYESRPLFVVGCGNTSIRNDDSKRLKSFVNVSVRLDDNISLRSKDVADIPVLFQPDESIGAQPTSLCLKPK